jgi:hypothetical protein
MTADFDDTARRMADAYWTDKFAPLIPEPARARARAEIEHLVAEARKGRRNLPAKMMRRDEWKRIAKLRTKVTQRLRAIGDRDAAAEAERARAAEFAVDVYNRTIEGTARQRDEPLRTVYSVALRIWTDTIGSDDLAASRTPPDKGGELYGAPLDFMAAIGLLVTDVAPRLETLAKYLADERAQRRNHAARAARAPSA